MSDIVIIAPFAARIAALLGLDLGGISVSTMGGVHGPQMSELAFLYMLAFARDVRSILARQSAARASLARSACWQATTR